MQTLPLTATDDEIKALVVKWSELIADKKFQEALELLPPCKVWQVWSPKELDETIAGYGSPDPHPDGVRFELTALLDFPNIDNTIQFSIKVDRVNLYGLDPKKYVGMVHYDDIPVKGYPDDPLKSYCSDMTARFNIKRIGDDHLTLEFLDIHVM